MATMNAAHGTPSPDGPDYSLPTSSHSESSGGVSDQPLQNASGAGPATSESDPNHSTVQRFFRGKENVGKALSERSGKLTLLELPVDILRLVVQEVRITSCAVTGDS